jgi:hypothetical protein
MTTTLVGFSSFIAGMPYLHTQTVDRSDIERIIAEVERENALFGDKGCLDQDLHMPWLAGRTRQRSLSGSWWEDSQRAMPCPLSLRTAGAAQASPR